MAQWTKSPFFLETGFEGLKVECIIGVYPEERVSPQTLEIDLFAKYESTQAANGDREQDALDYTLLGNVVTECAVRGKYGLLETLAQNILIRLENEFSAITEIELVVRKPGGMPGGRNSLVRFKSS
ncbi:MAG: dihydroneopterin aldolase [Spirochaetales bacterium]|nr:dihydroneopterin aldolase [Spirochaetales bacterium]